MSDTLFENTSNRHLFRPIHYLGSKFRFLPQLQRIIRSVVEPGSTVLDLFAGSGTVSLALADEYRVIATDVQEYSRRIAAALLNPPEQRFESKLMEALTCSELRRSLRACLASVLDAEATAIAGAGTDPRDLLEFVQWGSLDAGIRWENGQSDAILGAFELARTRLIRSGLGTNASSVCSRTYGGVYFSYAQAIEFDVLLDAIHTVFREPILQDYYVATVLSAASDCANTIGKQFAQPIRLAHKNGTIKHHLVSKVVADRVRDVGQVWRRWLARYRLLPTSSAGHNAIRADFRDALSAHASAVDAIYADPPYTRDHYSRYYHVLETMALRDVPTIDNTTRATRSGQTSRGVYRANRHQSPFCIKSKAPLAFRKLFELGAEQCVPLILSYSTYSESVKGRPRVMTIESIASLARECYSSVKLMDLSVVGHNKLNRKPLNAPLQSSAEVVLVCT